MPVAMLGQAIAVGLLTLGAGLVAVLLLRFLPSLRLQLAGLAALSVCLPLASVLLSGWVAFKMGDDVKILAVSAASATVAVVAGLVLARSIAGSVDRDRRRRGRHGEDLDVVAHLERDPAREQHRRERQADGKRGQACELESQAGEEPEQQHGDEPGDERQQSDGDRLAEHRDWHHGTIRYPTPHTVWRCCGSDGSASIFSRSRRTWTVTVPVSSAASYPHTRLIS